MKAWPLFLFYLLAITAYGQAPRLPTNPATGQVVYGVICLTPAGLTSTQIYDQSKKWMARTVTQVQEDAAARSVSGRGYVDVWDIRYRFTLRVHVTEDRGTFFTTSDITWQVMGSNPVETGTIEELRDSKRAGIGIGTRTKSLSDMNKKINAYTVGLFTEISNLPR